MIQFINVSKAYKQHNVLENINLSINEGELVVLIGPSGCGKTTLLKMINRLIDPTAGQILINGTDIIAQDPIELRRNMGYVIQQTGLFVHMTVRENIEIVPHLAKLPQDEIVERTVKLMEMVGLPQEFLDRYPNHLSGGQQQRIGVARAFAMDPGIILMDELGFLENDARAFQSTVMRALDGETPGLAAVKPKDTPFLRAVRGHENAELVFIDEQNRDALLEKLLPHILWWNEA